MAYHDSSTSLQRLHIYSPGASNVYFRHSAKQRPFSHGDMMAILALAADPKAFGQKLLAMSKKWEPNGFNLGTEFLATLSDYTDRVIPKEDIPSIFKVIFDVGDELWCHEKEMPKILGFGAYSYIVPVIHQLSRRLSEQERFEAYRDAFSKGRALATICRKARGLAGEHGHSEVGQIIPEQHRQLSKDHEVEIRKVAMRRVKAAAADGSLLDSRMPYPLRFWDDFERFEKPDNLTGEFPERPQDWAKCHAEKDSGLAQILESFLAHARDMNGERKNLRAPIDSLRAFLTPSTIIDRARGLLVADWLKGNQRVAVETFVKEYDDMVERGLNPDTDKPPEP